MANSKAEKHLSRPPGTVGHQTSLFVRNLSQHLDLRAVPASDATLLRSGMFWHLSFSYLDAAQTRIAQSPAVSCQGNCCEIQGEVLSSPQFGLTLLHLCVLLDFG